MDEEVKNTNGAKARLDEIVAAVEGGNLDTEKLIGLLDEAASIGMDVCKDAQGFSEDERE